MGQVLQLAVLLFAALATGALNVNWIGLGRAMSRLSASSYVEFHQATNRTFDPDMPIVVSGALLGGVVLATLSQGVHSLSGELAVAGTICYLAVLAIGLPTNVRINKQVARWSVQNRQATGHPFAPAGLDFTLPALSFHFQDWPATFLLVL